MRKSQEDLLPKGAYQAVHKDTETDHGENNGKNEGRAGEDDDEPVFNDRTLINSNSMDIGITLNDEVNNNASNN